MKAFLDYYQQHHIAPVNQDISNLQQHFTRRHALYRLLGLTANTFNQQNILEIGPGTGHNALYTQSLNPQSYTFIDGNPTSIQACQQRLAEFYPETSFQFIQSDFLELPQTQHYDVVLCEAVIPWQLEPTQFLNQVTHYVRSGGVLVITCSDYLSTLSEILRRYIAHILLHDHKHSDFATKTKILQPFFTTQLKYLQNMSRPVPDWIQDNILHPFIGQPLSIADAIQTVDKHFEFYQSSPQLIQDHRWYKDIHGQAANYNQQANNAYWRQCHNLLDHRAWQPDISLEQGQRLTTISAAITQLLLNLDQQITIDLQETGVLLSEHLTDLIQLITPINTVTAASMQDYHQQLQCYLRTGSFDLTLPNFSPWYGRGQQYVSFLKR